MRGQHLLLSRALSTFSSFLGTILKGRRVWSLQWGWKKCSDLGGGSDMDRGMT